MYHDSYSTDDSRYNMTFRDVQWFTQYWWFSLQYDILWCTMIHIVLMILATIWHFVMYHDSHSTDDSRYNMTFRDVQWFTQYWWFSLQYDILWCTMIHTVLMILATIWHFVMYHDSHSTDDSRYNMTFRDVQWFTQYWWFSLQYDISWCTMIHTVLMILATIWHFVMYHDSHSTDDSRYNMTFRDVQWFTQYWWFSLQYDISWCTIIHIVLMILATIWHFVMYHDSHGIVVVMLS